MLILPATVHHSSALEDMSSKSRDIGIADNKTVLGYKGKCCS